MDRYSKAARQHGAAMVEAALILPFLALVLMFAVEIHRASRTYLGMVDACQEAVLSAASLPFAQGKTITTVIDLRVDSSNHLDSDRFWASVASCTRDTFHASCGHRMLQARLLRLLETRAPLVVKDRDLRVTSMLDTKDFNKLTVEVRAPFHPLAPILPAFTIHASASASYFGDI